MNMKKILFFLVAILTATMMNVNAAERGKFIHVDASVNKNLKPQLAFLQEHKGGKDVTTLLVKTVSANNFYEFTDASRVLVRFADGTAIRLPRVAGSDVQKNKFSKKNGNATIQFCETVTTYETTPEMISKLESNIAIIKVRIVFKENDAKDYDIEAGYQAKMAADLLKSYQETAQKNKQSNGDLSDDDF